MSATSLVPNMRTPAWTCGEESYSIISSVNPPPHLELQQPRHDQLPRVHFNIYNILSRMCKCDPPTP